MGPQSEEEYFKTCDGRTLKSIQDLIGALREMDEGTYEHHVRGKNDNDFANWIRDVFKQRYLARALQLSKSKEETVKILFIHQFA